MDLLSRIKSHATESANVLKQVSENEQLIRALELAAKQVALDFKSGKALYSCGNGGSMAEAIHLAEELSGKYRSDRPALRAVSISDPGHLTCVANDYGYDVVFSRFIEAWGNPGDWLVLFTTSGQSANLLEAARKAKEKGMKTLAFSGKSGGQLASLVDIELRAPQTTWADRAQEVHQVLMHAFIDAIEVALGYTKD